VAVSEPATYTRGEQIIARCREIAAHTEVPGEITRRFLTQPMHGVHALLRGWMEAAGMSLCVDAAGNLRALFLGSGTGRLLLGSHLDTVPNAGAFDGILGVVFAVSVVESLQGRPLPFTIEILGFSEEEGVRFRKPFLGSLAVVGELDSGLLALTDTGGVSVADAIRSFGLDPARLPEARLSADAAAYLEVHIEQGPVLEQAGGEQTGALGIVEAIVGQTRLRLIFEGQANHAGTTPMHLRHDALAAAAEWVVAVEACALATAGLVATVGSLDAQPGVSNVIAGSVTATLDVRHTDDRVREAAVAALLAHAQSAAHARGVRLAHEPVLEQKAVPMDARLQAMLRTAVTRSGHAAMSLPSGAGHDAMILAPHVPSAMLFLPTPGGLGHHPDEQVRAADIDAALLAVLEFLRLFGEDETDRQRDKTDA
jgi:allantoate deiminase